MSQKNPIVTLVLLVVVAGAAFYGGMTYQKGKAPTPGQFAGRNGQAMGLRGGNNNNFRPINGDILSVDTGSLTVKLTDGSSKIILFNDKTTINKADTATGSDLKSGLKVAVFGQTNSDGSVTAQNIQLNPIVRDFARPSVTSGQ